MIASQGPSMRCVRSSATRLSLHMGALASVGLMLSGCSGNDVARAFGMERAMPDEYTVTTRAPLSMPPSEQLGLPGASDAHRPDESPRMQALETLSPDTALHPVEGTASSGQSALVEQADTASKAPNNAELGSEGAGFVDNLMFWNGGRAGSVVDGTAENRRIRENSALGRNTASGATPTAKGKSSGGFLGIF
ncbi:DUF3035 domain-containing protein [Gluconobacter wancherniae]|uniref:DUF3035 domain-containing protein n=1 Tax=Gluconobacter wancherniae NBRC 103581 TaxID=656744 RepID=A0A511B2B2_9PROT|nr:DUF3035 domain-containing protein [Gluconobacter wancherniae]MBF0854382.1 DUF3035 domain-containing protein [Gluconobacter wancherniae]MBS1062778.1 DUF3035 domain-containing protein [Gluconobacter wancherniae]MBS1088486.1 DUF3035 domain-containing protein [Gluconobacter wancherniae]MBS1094912.1 DUF3035 domain-containing protein [Gluconobacter wancherniae]GBD57443.1 hypothetical protein NBRC103581_02031 [Gluconobacter wancherniae NBRC 103581]